MDQLDAIPRRHYGKSAPEDAPVHPVVHHNGHWQCVRERHRAKEFRSLGFCAHCWDVGFQSEDVTRELGGEFAVLEYDEH